MVRLSLLCALLLCARSSLFAQVHPNDSLELVALYHFTDGPNWTQSWDLSQPVATWSGVTVDPTLQRVTVLTLDQNQLSGSLPSLSLPHLNTLDLQFNDLSGPLPLMSGLSQLRILHLGFNQLTGGVPPFSGNPDLRVIDLRNNNLSGTLRDLSTTPNLTELHLFGNQLRGALPNFSGLPDLTELQLGYNQFSGAIPDFSNLPDLRHLDLSGNPLTGPVPDFSNLPNLQTLSLGDVPLNSTFPAFSNLPALTQLELTNCGLTGPMPDLSNLPLLEVVLVNENQLTGEIPPFWERPAMYRTDFERNRFTSIAPMAALSSRLRFVYLFDNRLTFEDLIPYHNGLLSRATSNSGFYTFDSQDSVGVADTLVLAPGSGLTLDLGIDDTLTTNTYVWYRNGVVLDTVVGNNRFLVSDVGATEEGTYYCIITNSIVTVGMSGGSPMRLVSRPITLQLGTSTRRLEPSTFVLAPNPVHDQLVIQDIDLRGDYRLRLVSSTGQVVGARTYQSDQLVLSVGQLPPGVYVVQLIQDGALYQKRFVKQ